MITKTSFYQGPHEYPPDYNSGNNDSNSDWSNSRNMVSGNENDNNGMNT